MDFVDVRSLVKEEVRESVVSFRVGRAEDGILNHDLD